MPRAHMSEWFVDQNLHCIISYLGTCDGRRITVIVGTGVAGDRIFHYGDRDAPGQPFQNAKPAMIAAVRAYGFRDGMPDDADASA